MTDYDDAVDRASTEKTHSVVPAARGRRAGAIG